MRSRTSWGSQPGIFEFYPSLASDLLLWDLREAASISSLLGEEAPSCCSVVSEPMPRPPQDSPPCSSQARKAKSSPLPSTGCHFGQVPVHAVGEGRNVHVCEHRHIPYVYMCTYAHVYRGICVKPLRPFSKKRAMPPPWCQVSMQNP